VTETAEFRTHVKRNVGFHEERIHFSLFCYRGQRDEAPQWMDEDKGAVIDYHGICRTSHRLSRQLCAHVCDRSGCQDNTFHKEDEAERGSVQSHLRRYHTALRRNGIHSPDRLEGECKSPSSACLKSANGFYAILGR